VVSALLAKGDVTTTLTQSKCFHILPYKLYLVLEVVAPCALQRGVALGPICPYRHQAQPRLFCGGPDGMEWPLVLCLLPRTLSDPFYNQLKTVLFDHAGVGSTFE